MSFVFGCLHCVAILLRTHWYSDASLKSYNVMMKEKSLLQEWIILAIAISLSGFMYIAMPI